MISRRKFAIAACVSICVFFFCRWLDGYQGILFYIFQTRDLYRAAEILNGKTYFFGPEMTGGGNLPGPLYYYLLAMALAIDPAWESAWYLLGGFILFAGALGFVYMRRQFSWIIGLLWMGMFVLSPNSRRFLMAFLNVSYLLPFVVAAQILIALGFTAQTARARAASLLAACFVIGVGLQFHFSIFILFVALSFLAWRAPRFNLPPVERRLYLPAIALLFAPSLPYLIWLACGAMGLHFGQPRAYAGSAEFAMPSLLLLVNMAMGIPLREFLLQGSQHCIEAIPHAVVVLLLMRALTRKALPENSKERALRQVFTVCAWFGLPLFLFWFCAPIGNRYVQPFYVALTFYAAVEIAKLFRSPYHLKYFNAIAAVLMLTSITVYFSGAIKKEWEAHFYETFIVLLLPAITVYATSKEFRKFGLGAALAVAMTFGVSKMQRVLTRSSQDFGGVNIMPRHWEWRRIWTTVYKYTGWSYADAIQRTYFIGHHLEQDAYPGYQSALTNLVWHSSPNAVDGFIIAYLKPAADFETTEQARDWVLTQNIQADLKHALERGDIVLDQSLIEDMSILPYRIVNRAALPSQFHNSGEGYLRNSDEYLLDTIAADEAVVAQGDSRAVFKWNECPEHHVFCSTGALVDYFLEGTKLRIKTRVVGQSISQVSPWIGPNWTQAWLDPYLEIQCGGKTQRYLLATSIGYQRKYADDPYRPLLLGNNSMVAPFEREFTLTCNKLEAITVGREGSSIEAIYSLKILPAKRLTLTF